MYFERKFVRKEHNFDIDPSMAVRCVLLYTNEVSCLLRFTVDIFGHTT